MNTFTIKLTEAQARRLEFAAGETGKTPEAFIADAAMAMAYCELSTADFTDEKSDEERNAAASLNAVLA